MLLAELNSCDPATFVATLGGVFEHSPWVAERACNARPFASIARLHEAMMHAVREAPDAMQLALIRAHPELAGKAAVRGELTADSAQEQSSVGLDQCAPEELAQLRALNAAYSAKFGFPFVIAVKGRDRADILRELARRLERNRATELEEAVAQIARITRFRLDMLLAV